MSIVEKFKKTGRPSFCTLGIKCTVRLLLLSFKKSLATAVLLKQQTHHIQPASPIVCHQSAVGDSQAVRFDVVYSITADTYVGTILVVTTHNVQYSKKDKTNMAV